MSASTTHQRAEWFVINRNDEIGEKIIQKDERAWRRQPFKAGLGSGAATRLGRDEAKGVA